MRPVPRCVLSAFLAVVTVLLGACASGPGVLRASLTSFNEWPADIEKTYLMVAPVGAADNLEQKTYERLVAGELTHQGFREVDAAAARLSITVRARLTADQRWVSEPLLFDPFWRGPWANPLYPPGSGVFGGFGGYREYPVTIYHRSLTLEINDLRAGARGKRIYEGTVTSAGGTPNLPSVVPYLVRAMFTDFPGMNGRTRIVEVPFDAE